MMIMSTAKIQSQLTIKCFVLQMALVPVSCHSNRIVTKSLPELTTKFPVPGKQGKVWSRDDSANKSTYDLACEIPPYTHERGEITLLIATCILWHVCTLQHTCTVGKWNVFSKTKKQKTSCQLLRIKTEDYPLASTHSCPHIYMHLHTLHIYTDIQTFTHSSYCDVRWWRT